MAATSFRKKTSSKSHHPRGTRPSLHGAAHLLVSTGVPSMDTLIGGGQPVGSTLLIEEDQYDCYSRLLLKYFIAEGVMCGHSLLVSSAGRSFVNLMEDLPGPLQDDTSSVNMPTVMEEDDEMKIAWRYQNLPKVETSYSNQFGHCFDLTKQMEEERLTSVHKRVVQFQSELNSTEMYDNLLKQIENEVKIGCFHKKSSSPSQSILRIVIHSIGSPLWLEDISTDSTNLTKFFHSLRDILRESNAVAIISIPSHLFQSASFVRRIERLNDCVIKLEAFAGSDKGLNQLYKEYHGLFHIVKFLRLNSLTCHSPETLDLAFKLKRKKFSIEKLHLPPELPETTNRAQEEIKLQKKKAADVTRKIDSSRIDF